MVRRSKQKSTPDRSPEAAGDASLGGLGEIDATEGTLADRWRYGMLLLTVACQLATAIIAWDVWQVRESPPNLPLVLLPEFSVGWAIVLSLAAIPFWPRWGVAAHAAVYVLACLLDQYRIQPQIISLIVLMAACVDRQGLWLARWYLIALWLWAGLHKFLSPEWFGVSSWLYLQECKLPDEAVNQLHVGFAWLVAVSEIALAFGAIVAPRRVALACFAIHLAILLSLSPLLRNYNVSVWPWNLATAVVGAWILLQAIPDDPPVWAWGVTVAMFVLPIGFYVDWINPHLAFVLYSGGMPRALHTSPAGVTTLHAWTGLNVPFPDAPGLFVQAFERIGRPGDKLYIGDPRWAVADRYYQLEAPGQAREIPRVEFLKADNTAGYVAGLELADPQTVFELRRRGATIEVGGDGLLLAAKLSGQQVDDDLLSDLCELSNLRQLTLEHARIGDAGLAPLENLHRLEVLEFRACPLTDRGLAHLEALDALNELHLAEMPITSAGLTSLGPRERLGVLRLPKTQVGDDAADYLSRLAALEVLDLSGTKFTARGLADLQLPATCYWLNLSGTAIDDSGAGQLPRWPRLEIVQLADTHVSDSALAALAKLPRLEHLDLDGTRVGDAGLTHLASARGLRVLRLRGTQVTAAGVARLEAVLPECAIER